MEGAALHPGPAFVQHCPKDPVQLHDSSTAVSCHFLFFLQSVQHCSHFCWWFWDHLWVLSREVDFQHPCASKSQFCVSCSIPLLSSSFLQPYPPTIYIEGVLSVRKGCWAANCVTVADGGGHKIRPCTTAGNSYILSVFCYVDRFEMFILKEQFLCGTFLPCEKWTFWQCRYSQPLMFTDWQINQVLRQLTFQKNEILKIFSSQRLISSQQLETASDKIISVWRIFRQDPPTR